VKNKRLKVFAYIDRTQLRQKGLEIGLSGDALDAFTYFTEIELAIEVDATGMVQDVQALWREVKDEN